VMALMIHDLDILWQWRPEMPAEIMAVCVAGVGVGADHVVATLRYTDGALATLSASRLAHDRIRQIRCTKAGWHLALDLAQSTIIETCTRDAPEIKHWPVPASNALLDEYNAWAQALNNQSPSPVSLNDACQVMRLAESIIHACKS